MVIGSTFAHYFFYSKDATAAFTIELQEVAKELIFPLYANEVLTVDEWTSRLRRAENM